MPANPSITQEGFELLLDWLDTKNESAGEKYEKIRGRLIRIFVGRGCHEAELLASFKSSTYGNCDPVSIHPPPPNDP
jgi:hypothetical protein